MTKVYIVVKQDFETGYSILCMVFFKRALAEDWVRGLEDSDEYRIETYLQKEDGTAVEIH